MAINNELIKNGALAVFLALIIMIVLSLFWTSLTGLPVLKLGFLLIPLSVVLALFLIVNVGPGGRIEISMSLQNIAVLSILLTALVLATYFFIPQIYSILPDQTKQIFSFITP